MSNVKEFIETMSTKIVVGRAITNEEIMRGILMILQQDEMKEKVENAPPTTANDDFDAKTVALAFYRTNKSSTDKEQQRATKELKKELSYLQYMQVLNAISNLDENRYLISSLIREMGRVVD